ncbi:OmpA family protein [Saccharospirillum sp. HFRX-1]|uniref:flagellar protein MotY n=1 Tax=unclassified Saccharospirillum TaxID=2633430 RepID=UPI0037188339
MNGRQRLARWRRTAARTRRFSVSLMLASLTLTSQAVTFGTGMTDTDWVSEGNEFYCKFMQPIPNYGMAVFFQEAGRDLEFYLEVSRNLMAEGEAAITIEAPEWRSSALTSALGYTRVRERLIPLRVEPDRARRMMAELSNGMSPTLTRQAKYRSEPVRVRLSPVDFKQFYPQYLACSAGLLPVNFAQIERTTVLYPPGQDYLTPQGESILDDMITYIEADPFILSLSVVGHSDNQGTRYENRRLSERRANLVTDYLVEHGIEPGMIETDYQGDRYPVASNETVAGRNANRRTTILVRRLEDQPNDPLDGLPDFEAR